MNNEKYIFDYLVKEIGNEKGACALEGNWMAESRLIPTNLQDSFNRAWNVTDEQFTQMVDNGQFDFCCNGKGAWGYGLAQWTSVGRRINLWNYRCKKGTSIGNLQMQLEFAIIELKSSYKNVWNALVNATSIREASDIVLTRYEIPADQSNAVKEYRASLGQSIYDRYADKKDDEAVLYRVTANDGLYIRKGPGTNFDTKGGMVKGTIFAVTRVENGWGYIPAKCGWSYLKYAEYV